MEQTSFVEGKKTALFWVLNENIERERLHVTFFFLIKDCKLLLALFILSFIIPNLIIVI